MIQGIYFKVFSKVGNEIRLKFADVTVLIYLKLRPKTAKFVHQYTALGEIV